MFCDNLEVWDGVGGGFERERGHMHTYGSFTLLYGRKQHKAIILQLKKKKTINYKKNKLQDWNVNFILLS